MRIVGSNAAASVATGHAPRRAASGGFALAQAEAPKSAAAATALRTIGGIDALLALQGENDPAERKRRAVRRGEVALDALDELKLALLSDTLAPATLMRLKSAAPGLGDRSGDARLDALLAQIELRLEVEIAKIAPR